MRSPRRSVLFAIAFASCAQGQSCGCLGTLAPLPGPLPAANVTQNSATIDVSPAGFSFLESNFKTVLALALPQGLTFSIPETPIQTGCIFGTCLVNETICDPSACPYPNSASCADGCPINATVNDARIAGQPPNTIDLTILLTIDANQWGLGAGGACVPAVDAGLCTNVLWATGSPLNCAPELTVDDQPIEVPLQILFDPLTQAITVQPGTATLPTLTAADFDFSSCGLSSSEAGAVVSALAGQLDQQVAALLQTQLQSALNGFLCMPPGFYADAGCPAGTMLGDAGGLAVCEHPSGGCVAPPNGLVGTSAIGAILAAEGAPPALTEIELFPGEAADAGLPPVVPGDDAGLFVPVVGGFLAAEPSSCVAPLGPRSYAVPADIDFGAEAARLGVQSYMVGVGASQPLLQRAADQMYSAGLFCLSIDSFGGGQISTTELTPLFPALAQLAPAEPVTLVFHPESPPEVSIGAGTYGPDGGLDGGPGPIEQPLILLTLPNVRVDVFAGVDDRDVRILSFTADLTLPIALSVGAGGASLQILVGAPTQFFSNVQGEASPLLGLSAAETSTQLVKFVPVALGFVGSALGNLPDIALPSLFGFSPTVVSVGGIVPASDAGAVGSPGSYDDIGIFLDLTLAPDAGVGSTPGFAARLVQTFMPSSEEVGPGGTLSAWPSVTLALSGSAEPLEASYRIDEGAYRPWAQGSLQTVSDPLLLLAGSHALDVRVRAVGQRGPGEVTSLSVVSAFPPMTAASNTLAPVASPIAADASISSGNCASGAGGGAWLPVLALLLVRRRRR